MLHLAIAVALAVASWAAEVKADGAPTPVAPAPIVAPALPANLDAPLSPPANNLDERSARAPTLVSPRPIPELPKSAITATMAHAWATQGERVKDARVEAEGIWRDKIAPRLDPGAQTHSMFYAYLQAGDYQAVERELPTTREKLSRQAGLRGRLLGSAPVKAVDQLLALVKRQQQTPVAQLAAEPERFASRAEYYRFLRMSVDSGDISGYYARLMIGKLPDYSHDDEAQRQMNQYPAAYRPPR